MNFATLVTPAIFLKAGLNLNDDPERGFVILGIGICVMLLGIYLHYVKYDKK